LTPGAIYRRFPDKDALLETVVIGILERQDERLRTMLTPAMARQIPLAVFAEQLINNMLVSYRANAALLRAIRDFAQGRDHTAFYRKVTKLEWAPTSSWSSCSWNIARRSSIPTRKWRCLLAW
jgi:AcrR family transcriptional regulator